jgi:hypothetical protein
LKEPVDFEFGVARYAAPRRRRALYGGFGKFPGGSLTSLIGKRNAGGGVLAVALGYLDTDNLRSLERHHEIGRLTFGLGADRMGTRQDTMQNQNAVWEFSLPDLKLESNVNST